MSPLMAPVQRTLKYAGLGAAVTLVVLFLPMIGLVAPLVGGGAAGYFARDTERFGAVVGGLSGGLVWLLTLPLLFFFGTAAMMMSVPLGSGMAIYIAALGLGYLGAAGALGGYLGGTLSESERPTEQSAPDPVTELKEQYVNGDLSEAEFERRVKEHLDDEPTGVTIDSYRDRERE